MVDELEEGGGQRIRKKKGLSAKKKKLVSNNTHFKILIPLIPFLNETPIFVGFLPISVDDKSQLLLAV